MSYLGALIAVLMTLFGEVDGLWLDAYLDNLVAVESWFLGFSWVLFWIAVAIIAVIVIGSILASRNLIEGILAAFTTGSITILMLLGVLILPLFGWLTKVLAVAMAESVTGDGVTDMGKLIVCAIVFLMLGSG
jgi:hypothetical protein